MIINNEEETRFNNSIFDHNKQTSFKINFIKGDKAKKTHYISRAKLKQEMEV